MSYYDEPLLKPPVWRWYIPAYFVLGGVAGASSALAAATPLTRLRRRGRRVALVSIALGTVALVADLGRPERFVNMLRVFRPTSPMSVGSWLLAAYGPAAGAAAVLPAPLANAAGFVAGTAGIPVASYTGVLVAGTAVPAWQDASTSLPALFASSAMSASASVLGLAALDDDEARTVRRYAIAGKLGELTASAGLEAELADDTTAKRAYREGPAGKLWATAHAVTATSLVLSLPRKRNRARELVAAVTGLVGSVLTKLAVYEAGRVSVTATNDVSG